MSRSIGLRAANDMYHRNLRTELPTMRTSKASLFSALFALALIAGCKGGKSESKPTTADSQKQTSAIESWPAVGSKSPSAQPKSQKTHVIYTADNNPTTLAGRGAPSLDDQFRPAAWIFIDGKDGKFTEVNGSPHLEWVIETPVTTSPTFRVAVYPPLLGEPDEFKAVIQSIETADGSKLMYGLTAEKGSFDFGRDYSLLNPGSGFTVRNLMTGDVVSRISELPEGRYLIAGGIENTKKGARTPAVTFFSVSE